MLISFLLPFHDFHDKLGIMKTVRVGEITTSPIGLECGGFSRPGLVPENCTDHEAVRVIQTAYDLGIRFFDTAEAYGTESCLGLGLEGKPRSGLTLCSKLFPLLKGQFKSPGEIRRSLESTLANLRTDYIDIYYVHGVTPEEYEGTVSEIYPVLNRLKEEGLIRQIGISEMFGRDLEHCMMEQAVSAGIWDAVMIGYNIMNQSGAELLRRAGERGIFRVDMFAVRQALTNNEVFGVYMDRMIREGKFHFTRSEFYEFKDELFRGTDAVSFPGLAYRFVRDRDCFDVILTGTGNIEHLKDNVTAMDAPVLSERVKTLLVDFFSGENLTSGQEGFF